MSSTAIQRLVAIGAQDVHLTGDPEISLKKFVPFTTLEFEAIFPIIGEIILPNYKSIKFSKKKVAVTETEVTGVIDMLRKRLAEKSDVTRIAKKDDEVTIDFKDRISGSVNSVSSTVYLLFVIVIGVTLVKPVLYFCITNLLLLTALLL